MEKLVPFVMQILGWDRVYGADGGREQASMDFSAAGDAHMDSDA
jgi:hypothetical protein